MKNNEIHKLEILLKNKESGSNMDVFRFDSSIVKFDVENRTFDEN